MAIASDGTSIYVVGYVKLAALPGQTALGGADAFVRKYDSNGNEQWTRQFGTVDAEQAYGVAVDASGVYVTGRGGALAQPAQGTDDTPVRGAPAPIMEMPWRWTPPGLRGGRDDRPPRTD